MKNRILVMSARAVVIMAIGYVFDEVLLQMYSRDKRVAKLVARRRR